MANVEHQAAWEAGRKRNILMNARKTWLANTPRAHEILDAAESGRDYDNGHVFYKEGFMGSMASALDNFGKLSPKQCEAILKGIDARAAKKAEWASEKAVLDAKRAHIGTVGQKVTMTLTVVHLVVLEGMYGTTYIHICEDADQNVVIYKGNSSAIPGKGHTVTVIATIKEHGVRDGVKQTVIQRPKSVEVALG
jgi:uncharacterized protein YfbU (UPF0304 family)